MKVLIALVVTMLTLPCISVAQNRTDAVRTINLDDHIIQVNGVRELRKKSPIADVSMVFDVNPDNGRVSWDSSMLLTKFFSPSAQTIKLTKVEARLATYDTSKFEIYLAVLQIAAGDTMLREVPITPNSTRLRKQRLEILLSNYNVAVDSGVFYLGYSFKVKNITDRHVYRLYASTGGDGLLVRRTEGKWTVSRNIGVPNVFPFKIFYLESPF